MLAVRKQSDYSAFQRRYNQFFRTGDRIVTKNRYLGTVVGMERDESGEYVIVKLDSMSGTYAYESTDIEKL